MALRMRAGRSRHILLQLMSCGLFSCPDLELHDGEPRPAPGLTAKLKGMEVLILGRFSFRGKAKFDVAPLLAMRGPRGCTHVMLHRKAESCYPTELTHVGFRFRVVAIRKRKAWLARSSASEAAPVSHEAAQTREKLEPYHGADAKQVDASSVISASLSSGLRLARPGAALEHAEAEGHRVGPRDPRYSKAVAVWDIPWPVEVDARAWRCWTCKSHGGRCGSHWFPVMVADVQAAVPEALCHYRRTEKSGPLFCTSRFLTQLFTALYSAMSFRAVRRKLIGILTANALAGVATGGTSRLQAIMRAFPRACQLRSLALASCAPVVQKRVDVLMQLQAYVVSRSVLWCLCLLWCLVPDECGGIIGFGHL